MALFAARARIAEATMASRLSQAALAVPLGSIWVERHVAANMTTRR